MKYTKRIIVLLLMLCCACFAVQAQFINPLRFGLFKPVQPDTTYHKLTWTVIPSVSYAPETNFGLSLMGDFIFNPKPGKIRDDFNRSSRMNVQLRYTLSGAADVKISPEFYLGRFYLKGYAGISNIPYDTWGLGPDASQQEAYTQLSYRVDARALYEVGYNIYLGLGYRYYNYQTTQREAGGVLDNGSIIGSTGSVMTGPSAYFQFDTRDDNILTSKGMLVKVDGEWTNRAFGSTQDYTSMSVDLRKYVQLGRRPNSNHVLAFNAYSRNTFGETPFYDLSGISGPTYLKGYLNRRYIDKCAFAIQAEYRWYFGRFGLAFYAGTGDVGPTFEKAFLGMNKYAAGIGARYKMNKNKRTVLRFDLAYGRDGLLFYGYIDELF